MGGGDEISRRIGAVIGCTAFWPLVFIGLFAIFRRFRTPRTRQTIMIVIWGIFILSHLTSLGRAIRLREPASDRIVPEAAEPRAIPVAVRNLPAAPSSSPVALPPDVPLPDDFSPGSDTRLVELIDGAQKERYHAMVAAYVRVCSLRPNDALLALERVRFIERFLYSEDLTIDGAEEDHEAALTYLNTRFPQAPGTILHELNQTIYTEVEAKAARYAEQTRGWPAQERAKFLLLRANAADQQGGDGALAFARESFVLYPTVEAGLLLAGKHQEANARAESREILLHPVFAGADPWAQKRRLDLLLKIGEIKEAVALYAAIRAENRTLLLDPETATALAEAGRITEAREVFTDMAGGGEWLRKRSVLRRFAFELEHGDVTQASAAYRALRESGLSADPFSRYRYELFRRHPDADWEVGDFAGFLMLGLFSLIIVVLPLGLLLPVHYWSLLRERKGKTGGWPGAHWGLRQTWFALGVLLLSSILGLWFLSPEEMRSWFTEQAAEPDVISLPARLTVQIAGWTTLTALLLWQIVRRQAWSLYRPAGWSFGRSILLGIGAALAGRFCLGAYLRIWPEAGAGEVVAALTQTAQMGVDLHTRWGPLGLLGVMAVFVPVLEETLFRGVVLQGLGKHVPFAWANGVQALLFAAVHENFGLFPFYFGLGFVCGELTRRSGSLLPAITMHTVNNAIACVGVIVAQRIAS